MTQREPEKWLKIQISAPAEQIDALGNFLEETGAQGVFSESLMPPGADDFPESTGPEIINAFFPADARTEKRMKAVQKYLKSLEEIFPDAAAPALSTETITDPDWGEQWKKYFKPIRVCRNIVVKPTWERYAPDSRDIVVEIDPGMAFGTGQHASTRMCMEAIEDIILNDRSIGEWKVLDAGCGTGILGITAAKMGAQDVICVDNDPRATEIAAQNALINAVEDRIKICNKDAAQMSQPRNLIIANLTAKLLLKMRPHLVRQLLPGGYLIISGIIEADVPAMEEHFMVAPLVQYRRLTEKEWVCCVLRKENSGPS